MLENWVAKRALSDDSEDVINGRELRFFEPSGPLTRDLSFVVAIEARRTSNNSRQTLFTLEVFQEMVNFENWLASIVYPVRPPGLPSSLLNAGITEPPLVSWG